MTDKYFAPLGDEPTPNDFEDEFTRALRAQPDTAVTESWAARAASLPRLIRRRRTAKIVGSVAASVALVLGATVALAQLPTSVTAPPPPANPGPAPAKTPFEISCTTTLDQALNAPVAVDGFTLTEFDVDVDGAGSAVLSGPNSANAAVDGPWLDDAPSAEDTNFDREGLGALWFPLGDTDLSIPNPEVFDSSVLNPALIDPASIDPSLKPTFGSFPFARTTTPSSLRTSEKRSMSEKGLSVGNQQLRTCPNPDGPSIWVGAWPSAVTGTYAVVGFGYIARVDPDLQSWESRQALVAGRVVIVTVKESVVTVIARPVREGASAFETDADREPATEFEPDSAANLSKEKISRTDGSPLTFTHLSDHATHASRIDPPQSATSQPIPDDQRVGLVSLANADAGLWIARRTTEPDDGSQAIHTQWGTWTKTRQFRPWQDTQQISASQARWSASFAVADQDPGQIVWIESEGIQTAVGPFWIFAANSAETQGPRLIVGPEDTAGNTLDSHVLAVFNGRVYWDEQSSPTGRENRTVVRSASLTGEPNIRTEATDALRPVAGPGGIWVTTVEPDTATTTGLAKLTDGGVDQFITLTDADQSLVETHPSKNGIAVNVDDTIYVIPFEGDRPVWAVTLDPYTLSWFDYRDDQLMWKGDGQRVYVANPWQSDRITYYVDAKDS